MKEISNEDKIKAVLASKEVNEAVKLLYAVFKDAKLYSFIQCNYSFGQNEDFKLMFTKMQTDLYK